MLSLRYWCDPVTQVKQALSPLEVDRNFQILAEGYASLKQEIEALKKHQVHQLIKSIDTDGRGLIFTLGEDQVFNVPFPKFPIKARGMWKPHHAYEVMDLVQKDLELWLCKELHTSSVAWDEKLWQSVWRLEMPLSPLNIRELWSEGEVYKSSDMVQYKGGLYLCKKNHTSGQSFEEDREAKGYWKSIYVLEIS